ncbi:MAG: hypothetical protein ABJC89_19985, partial [Acidobacteriota bacterium]
QNLIRGGEGVSGASAGKCAPPAGEQRRVRCLGSWSGRLTTRLRPGGLRGQVNRRNDEQENSQGDGRASVSGVLHDN